MNAQQTDLINVANAYNDAKAAYTKAARAAIDAVEPTQDDDFFWSVVEEAAKRLVSYGAVSSEVRRSVGNALWNIMNEGDWSLEAWERCASVYRRYRQLVSRLSDKCWEMPGVEKSDDSYGDWTDALPLAGRKVVEGIFEDDIANYKQVGKAIEECQPKLLKRIQNGENYVAMKMEEVLIEKLASVAGQARRADDDEI